MSKTHTPQPDDIDLFPEDCAIRGETIARACEIPALLAKMGLGKRVARSTVFRWLTSGSHGVRLDGVRVGGQWYTSVEAVRRFIAATTATATSEPSDSPTIARPSMASPTHHAAVRKLRGRGMKV